MMKKYFCILFIVLAIGVAMGNAQSQPVDSVRAAKAIDTVDTYPTALGDTSDLSLSPPDFVEYSIEPKQISRVDPYYPEEAMTKELQGNVFLKCWITKKGTVRRAVILKSDQKIFNRPALEAALQWKFEPAKYSDGTPVEVWVSIPFRFRLK